MINVDAARMSTQVASFVVLVDGVHAVVEQNYRAVGNSVVAGIFCIWKRGVVKNSSWSFGSWLNKTNYALTVV